ncbi:hypothetical protein [Hymenobacter armeniacus]|uniref:Uncharacterized protein n=1 Tax=Hymenobacter armeniacus TaxID=2771358 RepID=A0ABR8JWM9_9BACT|nr:hypothetical protein [Hymenobacter armeniacus]MBD2723211.1 hypothetical protein [Hymenobacter armeniacus]
MVSHAQGIGNVGNILEDKKGQRQGRRLVGIVDRDKKFHEQPYLAQFTLVVGGGKGPTDTHCIYQHPERTDQYIIVLNPACDLWLLKAARQAQLPLDEMGVPTELESFKDFSKQNGVTKNPKMRELLWRIQQARPPMYRELAEFVASIMDIAPPRYL